MPAALPSNSEIPENVRLAFNRLAAGELSAVEDELEQLGEAPGISAELIGLLKAAYHGSADYEQVHAVMAVLRCRSDLTAEQQQWLCAELRKIWNQPDTPKTVMLKDDGMKLLTRYPGVENEDVLILYLKETAHDGVIGCAGMAVYSLESIGTARSLPGLKAYLEQMPSTNELEQHRRDKVRKLIQFIASKTSAPAKAAAPGGSALR
ncbi:MAG: hypothetical protein NTY98_05595 [Verrucomicrobia bacterium]|nr:hypothetical protein [Verrucomicrobiota bacterium]